MSDQGFMSAKAVNPATEDLKSDDLDVRFGD